VSEHSAPALQWTASLLQEAGRSADLPAAATLLARAGLPVFPCVPGGKAPLTSHGFHDATSDLSRVHEWWRRMPEANIGVPTGAATEVVVVDVDVHFTGTGFPAFERARRAGLVAGWSFLVRTPSGGLHAFYPAGATEQRSWQVPGRHIDFRGDGGYIVVPPSRVVTPEGVRTYEVIAIAQQDPRPLDAAALRTFLEPPRPVRPPGDLPELGSRPAKLAAWVAARPEGARNHGLFWAACRMAESGHSLHSSLDVLGAAARAAGLSEREVDATIRSAHRIAARLSTASGPGPPAPGQPLGR
jgi:hypothetical protein